MNKSCNLHDEWRVLLLRKRPLGQNFIAHRSTVLMVMVRYRSSVLLLYVLSYILSPSKENSPPNQINHFTLIVLFWISVLAVEASPIQWHKETLEKLSRMMTRLLKIIQSLLFQVGPDFFVNHCAAGQEASFPLLQLWHEGRHYCLHPSLLRTSLSSTLQASFCRYFTPTQGLATGAACGSLPQLNVFYSSSFVFTMQF